MSTHTTNDPISDVAVAAAALRYPFFVFRTVCVLLLPLIVLESGDDRLFSLLCVL